MEDRRVLDPVNCDEIGHADQFPLAFDSMKKLDNKRIESYVVLAVELNKDSYTRTELSQATREINKLFPMPALVLFKCGEALTLAVIVRRLHKRDTSKDVLEMVSLIRDVSSVSPHRAHVEILFDLSLPQLVEKYEAHNFVELHEAWRQTLDSSELNKRFYQEMAHWYYWALGKVKFPKGAGKSEEVRNPLSLIRLLTRLIFVWFIKEKGLVPDQLFDRRKLEGVVKFGKPSETIYYKAILQNLFFATLNTEMGDDREWRNQPKKGGLASDYMVHNKYRYADYFVNPAQSLELFANIPFLNGGLFECLDKSEEERVDGFSERPDNELRLPDELFFSTEHAEDLSKAYGDERHDHDKVRGLIDILQRYKFTVNENTPIEEEVALDPELLGKVFENLLAEYNPETGTTARKQTGSFYTPREIVNYMVDESLMRI